MKDNININYGPLPEYRIENKKEYLDLMRSPLQNYCKEAIKQFGYLDNQGLALDDDDNQGGPVYIDDLYVLPKAGVDRISPEMLAKIDGIRNTDDNSEDIKYVNSKVDQLSSIAELIWKTPRLTLLGDPGVGKTTLMQWLICSLCHWSNNHAKQYLGPMFPLTITARKISEKSIGELNSGGLYFDDFIDEILSMQGDQLNQLWGGEEKKCLYSLFKRGQVLLLVDGLDEISGNAELWLNNNIRDLLKKYPSTHLIMTARVVGFNQFNFWGVSKTLRNKEVHAGILESSIELDDIAIQSNKIKELHLPEIFYLAPFLPDQRKQFSENWVANYLPPINEKRKSFIDNIDEVSAHSFQLDALSRIPVLLNLICFIQWRRGKLPNGRAELYQRIVETYLVAMDRARLLTHELSDEYDYQDIKNWLGRLAFNMQSGDLKLLKNDEKLSDFNEEQLEVLRHDVPEIDHKRILQVSGDELHDFFKLHLTEVLPISELGRHSTAIIDYLKNRTGFLIPRGIIDGKEKFGFSHLSFQEYFCAYFLNNNFDDLDERHLLQLAQSTKKESWSEIFQLLFEEMSLTGRSRTYVDKSLSKIFPFEDDLLDKYGAGDLSSSLLPTYAKIINNPSIKLSSAIRYDRKEKLTLMYMYTRIVENSTMTGISNDVIENWKRECSEISLPRLFLSDEKINNIAEIIDYDIVTHLSLNDMEVNGYGFTSIFENVSVLELSYSYIRSVDDICMPERITALDITHTKIADLSSIKNMMNLESLYSSAKNLHDIYTLLPSITSLRIISDEEDYIDFSYLADLGGVKELGLFGDYKGRLPARIEGENVEEIEVFGDFDISLAEVISNLEKLKKISLYCYQHFEDECFNMSDWDCMSSVETIEINISCNINICDFSNSSSLKELSIFSSKLLNVETLLKLPVLETLSIEESKIEPSLVANLEEKGVIVLLL